MQFRNLAVLSSVLTLAAAAPSCPAPQPPASPDNGTQYFGLISIRSGSPIQNSGIVATQASLLIGRAQNASCDAPSNFATFALQQNGDLYLYAASATPQQLYVDRSGMGQGKVGYTTGAQPGPRNGERGPFVIDANNHLTLNGTSFQACPTGAADGAYVLWASGVTNPAGYQGCLGVALRVIPTQTPIGCLYKEQ